MGNGGGIIQNTIPSFKLGLGGPISLKGDQILNWIHMDDEVGIIKFLLETPEAHGIVNAVAPEIQTNKQWAQAFASALGRPCIMFVPHVRWTWLTDPKLRNLSTRDLQSNQQN